MENIKTYESFISNIKKSLTDYWKSDIKEIPDISDIKNVCRDCLIDLEDKEFEINYKAFNRNSKYDISGNYKAEKILDLEISIKPIRDLDFNSSLIIDELLFLLDFIKMEYNIDTDNIHVKYEYNVEKVNLSDGDDLDDEDFFTFIRRMNSNVKNGIVKFDEFIEFKRDLKYVVICISDISIKK